MGIKPLDDGPEYEPPKGVVVYSSPTFDGDDESGKKIREELQPQIEEILKKHGIEYTVTCTWENQKAYRYMLKYSTFHDVGVDRSKCIPQVYLDGKYKGHVPEIAKLDAKGIDLKAWMADPEKRGLPVKNRWGEWEDEESERLYNANVGDQEPEQ